MPPLTPQGVTLDQANPAQTVTVRVASTDPDLEALAATWEQQPIPELRFGGAAWQVEEITSDPARHPWAGRASYTDLVAAGVQAEQRGTHHWTFAFRSPVTFRRKGLNMPFPLPELVFGSLLDRWNAAAPMPFPDDLREQALARIAVESVDLHSVRLATKGNALQIGTVGQVTYTLTGSLDLAGRIETLARFAAYSGIGAGVARGMGTAQLVDPAG
jgi:CRISPR-associated endoribonuclease Cas6